MKEYTVRRYQKDDFTLWNTFVGSAKNATFLFDRNFMEYHADRFEDYSLLVFKDETLTAIFPANRAGNTLYSHQGLTYGGLILNEKSKLNETLVIFRTLLYYLHSHQIMQVVVKSIPAFYCRYFSDELAYCLFITKATLIRRDALSTIDLKMPYFISKTRRESINRGKKNNLVIKEEIAFDVFWNQILIPNLTQKHQIKPVHTAAEMALLHHRFPNNIRHFNVYFNEKIVAGTTVFVTEKVAHPQYISGNSEKNELGSLDFLYHHLITSVFKDKAVFDFGISNEEQGRKINSGLLFWKESFGAKTVTQDFYEVATSNYHLLDSVLL